MIEVAAVFLLLAVGLVVWSYGVYPPLIFAAARRRGAPGLAPVSRTLPSVEVILSAADEEEVIFARVENLLGQGGVGGVAVGCDGCTDRTAALAREAASSAGGADRVRVVEFRERRGKAAVVNDLVREARAEILVFTDANTRFEDGAVRRLAEAFADETVGAVCGRLVFEQAGGARETPESAFWDRETRLKEAEGRLGICLGANGAIYAARRELVVPLPEDTTSMDDFLIPVRVARAGKRILFEGEAVAREDAARDVAAEVQRRFRIGIGAGQVLRREPWLWSFPRHPALTFAFLSRKAARWLAPLSGLAAAVAALLAPASRAAGATALALATVLLAGSRLKPRLTGTAGKLYYFAVLNVALALGVAAGLAGYARPIWRRTARS